MSEVLKEIKTVINNNNECMLCVIASTKGATPRKMGSKMIVSIDGKTYGSVGGGELEFNVIKKASQLLNQKKCWSETYQLSGSVASKNLTSTGMICGGQVTIIFLYLNTKDAKITEIFTLANWLDKDFSNNACQHNFGSEAHTNSTPIVDRANEDNNYFWFKLTEDYSKDFGFTNDIHQLEALYSQMSESQTSITKQLEKFGCCFSDKNGILVYIEKINPPGRVIIFGAGHISAALAPIMKYLGCNVVVYDPRDYLFGDKAFDNADTKIIASFSNIKSHISINSADNIVVATPSHADDFYVLLQVLNSGAKYIGCLGSKKKTEIINSKLLDANFSTADIERIDSPIGLNIGAQTPKEIAISIAAKIIDCNSVKKDW